MFRLPVLAPEVIDPVKPFLIYAAFADTRADHRQMFNHLTALLNPQRKHPFF